MRITEGQLLDLTLVLHGYEIGGNKIIGLKNYPNIGVSLRWKIDKILEVVTSRGEKTQKAVNELRGKIIYPYAQDVEEGVDWAMENQKIQDEISSILAEPCELEIPTLSISDLKDREGNELSINDLFDGLKPILTE